MRKQSSPGLNGLSGRPWLMCLVAVAIGAWLPQPVAAQTTVQRTAKGASGKDIRIGVYVNVLTNCSSGPLPAIQMIVPPENGSATVKRAKVSLTNYKNCMALEVPAFIGIYRSKPNFAGSDHLTLSVSYPNGRTETQQITITVGAGQNRGRDI
ncbi:MAG: hypothetical protein J0G33_09920 [Afipia felis]|nr:hypothetical protein [Afipia felis]